MMILVFQYLEFNVISIYILCHLSFSIFTAFTILLKYRIKKNGRRTRQSDDLFVEFPILCHHNIGVRHGEK